MDEDKDERRNGDTGDLSEKVRKVNERSESTGTGKR